MKTDLTQPNLFLMWSILSIFLHTRIVVLIIAIYELCVVKMENTGTKYFCTLKLQSDLPLCFRIQFHNINVYCMWSIQNNKMSSHSYIFVHKYWREFKNRPQCCDNLNNLRPYEKNRFGFGISILFDSACLFQFTCTKLRNIG